MYFKQEFSVQVKPYKLSKNTISEFRLGNPVEIGLDDEFNISLPKESIRGSFLLPFLQEWDDYYR